MIKKDMIYKFKHIYKKVQKSITSLYKNWNLKLVIINIFKYFITVFFLWLFSSLTPIIIEMIKQNNQAVIDSTPIINEVSKTVIDSTLPTSLIIVEEPIVEPIIENSITPEESDSFIWSVIIYTSYGFILGVIGWYLLNK